MCLREAVEREGLYLLAQKQHLYFHCLILELFAGRTPQLTREKMDSNSLLENDALLMAR